MVNDRKISRALFIGYTLATAIIYVLLDLPIRLTNAYPFPTCIGIKSFLPFSCGIFFGPAGALGTVLGAAVSGVIDHSALVKILGECLCVLTVAMGSWLLWYAVYRNGHIRFERFREVGIYIAIVLGLSVACGVIFTVLMAPDLFLPVFFGYMIMGLLVGLLVNIMLGGIFCVIPVLPPFCKPAEGITILMTAESPRIDEINEAIEMEAMARKIPMKRVFEIENCLEELYIRVQKNLPSSEIHGRVEMGSTISMSIWVAGEKYNPFRARAGEDEMDQVGLKLLRHRALRASYDYGDGQNRIHVVV